MTNLFKTVNNTIQDKRRYRKFMNDIQLLPVPYAKALTAIQKYIWNFAQTGGIMDGLESTLQIFKECAADQVPINQILGNDPVEFAESIMAESADELWINKYRNRLRIQIKEAENNERN
ncbi:DUF1048 domain-containing protein [Companilactobacillus sp.]|uniref:DUF1048 domain-containing protein n=1 Tax=Companilactobacillus sp. TaxID=2767905 RepID=UPI00260D1889|nr:DUF1048 domain-containing protein [Companilactobacillus sp.]